MPIFVFAYPDHVTDAVWPIIGHITWMFDLWDRIIFAMTSEELDKGMSQATQILSIRDADEFAFSH